jgi:hypothetical protein
MANGDESQSEDPAQAIEVTPEMEIEGGKIIQNHTDYTTLMSRDVAREVFLAMSDKMTKSCD